MPRYWIVLLCFILILKTGFSQTVCNELNSLLDSIFSLNNARKAYSTDIKAAWKVYKERYAALKLFDSPPASVVTGDMIVFNIPDEKADTVKSCLAEIAKSKNWFLSERKITDNYGFRSINLYDSKNKTKRILLFYSNPFIEPKQKKIGISLLWQSS
jgi:hypothetical protein